MQTRRWMPMLAGMVLLLAACGTAGDSTEEAAPERGAALSGAPGAPEAEGGDGGSRGAGGTSESAAYGADAALAQSLVPEVPPPAGDRRVIKNVALALEVEEGSFAERFGRATAVADQLGGFVTHSQVSETEGELASGTLTLRVPSDRFEEAITRLRELGRVSSEDRSGQDVSRQFVDLEARLAHARTQEAFYLRLIDEADSISDMIQIQGQLSQVQLQIEQIQGELNYLKDQTSYSTITVRLFEPGAAGPGPVAGLSRAFEEAIDGFQSVVGGLVVAAGWVAPIALLVLAGLGVWKLRTRTKPRGTPDAPATSG